MDVLKNVTANVTEDLTVDMMENVTANVTEDEMEDVTDPIQKWTFIVQKQTKEDSIMLTKNIVVGLFGGCQIVFYSIVIKIIFQVSFWLVLSGSQYFSTSFLC